MNYPRTGILVLLLTLFAAIGCSLETSGLPSKGGARDTIQPTVSSTEPKDAATDVLIGTLVNAVFSEAMAPSTLTGATFTLTHGGELASGTVTYADGIATFTPVIALALGTLYTATITTGVNDLAHNAAAADYTWSFTTRTVANTTPPTVTSTSPTNGALNVAANAELRATFSKALDPLTVTDSTFSVTREGTPIAGTVTYAGKTATFAPSSDLDLESIFLATVTTGVTDVLGNALADKFTWMFTTATRPTVIAENPKDGAQGAAINTHVEATFSVAMDPTTITTETFLVKQGATPVSGTVTYLDATATFAPTNNYLPNAMVTVVITTGAKDLSGSALGQDHVWNFQTGTKVNQAPVALGLALPFAVLASDTVANTVSVGTIVTGNLGISPGASLMGFPPGVIVGQTFLGAGAAGAKVDFLKAYNDAVGRPGAAALPADIAALTFTPGLYGQVSAVGLSAGSCTLDAKGDPNAVFIFQIGTALGLAASTEIILIGGAKATNVYWVVGASVTLGATSKLKGTILSAMDITLGAGATVEGRLLAGGATITLDTNVITVPAL